MITKAQFDKEIDLIIANAIREDVGDGDHSSLACIPDMVVGKAKLLVKDGIAWRYCFLCFRKVAIYSKSRTLGS